MRSIFRVALLSMLFVMVVKELHGDTLADNVRAAAERESHAVQRGDIDVVVSLTYPKLVELAGGAERIKATIAAQHEQFKSKGIMIDSVVVEPPEQPVTKADRIYCVVPMTVRMKGQNVKVTQRSFLLAVSTDNGGSWTFLDGSGLSPAMIAKVLPELPPEVKLPKLDAPTIDRQ